MNAADAFLQSHPELKDSVDAIDAQIAVAAKIGKRELTTDEIKVGFSDLTLYYKAKGFSVVHHRQQDKLHISWELNFFAQMVKNYSRSGSAGDGAITFQ